MNPCVLLVHSNLAVRTLLGVRLRKAGFEPIFANDGLGGLGAARQRHPALALIDMTFPLEGSRELANTLAGSAELPVEVCLISDRLDRRIVKADKRVRCLTRGQVFHPAFPAHLMNRILNDATNQEATKEMAS